MKIFKQASHVLLISLGPLLLAGLTCPTSFVTAQELPNRNPASRQALEDQIAKLETRLGEEPQNTALLTKLGRAYRDLGEISGDMTDLRVATDFYVRAANLTLERGWPIRFTRELMHLLVAQRDLDGLRRISRRLLASPADDVGYRYIALVDFGDGLARLGDEAAWGFFEEALELRPNDNTEAVNRYTEHLMEEGMYEEALRVLDSMPRERRVRYHLPSLRRQEVLRRLGLDTTEADEEVEATRRWGRSGAFGARPPALGERSRSREETDSPSVSDPQ